MNIYPIKFEPILKEKIWGGNKLSTFLNKKTNSESIGESWEISGVKDNVSIVSNGIYSGQSLNDLIRDFKGDFLGHQVLSLYGENFPLLIKFLDANTNLSVQVHPDDDMAKSHHDSFGKTEMWYIMESDEEAEIIIGLKNDNLNRSVLRSVNSANVYSIFNSVNVKKGDSFFIPAGMVHAIGAGILAAEIQQTSDITYRVYDWDRQDSRGEKRELHTELARTAIKMFDSSPKCNYQLETNGTSNLVDCKYFTTNILEVKGPHKRNYKDLDSFLIFMCVEGQAEITVNSHTLTISLGETVLIPADCESVILKSSDSRLLEVYIDLDKSSSKKLVS